MPIRTMELLIIDDSEDWRDSLALIFAEMEDIVLTSATGGEEGIEKIKAHEFDLVLLDMRMPSGTEGLDALRVIKDLKPQVAVIMMSAYGDIPKAVEAMKRGALDFVAKDADFKDAITFKVNEFIRKANLIADRERLINSLYRVTLGSADSAEKGKALESLVAAIFASVKGFIEVERNCKTADEEIDIVIRNDGTGIDWQKESLLILIECKNWHSKRVGKNEFVLFKAKMENRAGRCELGFLICTTVFADTIEKEMLRSSSSNLLVVPIDGERLKQLVESLDRSELLRKYVDAALLT